MAYKKDQGRAARMVAFWTLVGLLIYGSNSFLNELVITFPSVLGRPFGYVEGQAKSGIHVPVLGAALSPAFLITGLLFCGGAFLIYRWMDRPKNADLLIETESELRKVNWPTFPESLDSSVIVIVTVLVLMLFLSGSDWVLGRWAVFFFTSGS